MKNLNPYSGLNQVRKGYFCFPRQIALDRVRGKILKVNELGYFIVFLSSADWDVDPNRKGFIRHDLRKLSKIWKISYQTLNDNLKKLINKKIITKELNTPKIPDFNRFTLSGATQIVKQANKNEKPEQYFADSFSDSEIPLQPKIEELLPFKSSSKVNFTEEDKVWLSMSQLERDVLEIFFNNDFALYQQSLIIN